MNAQINPVVEDVTKNYVDKMVDVFKPFVKSEEVAANDANSSEPFTLVSTNNEKEQVVFKKDATFLSSLKQYIGVMNYGVELANLNYIEHKTSAPTFHQEPKKTIADVKRRFNIITKKSIQKHPVWQEKIVKFSTFERRGSLDAVTNNPDDIANLGRYKINALMNAYIPVDLITDRLIRLDAADKVNVFTGILRKYYERNWGSDLRNNKQIIDDFGTTMSNEFDIFLYFNKTHRTTGGVTSDYLQITKQMMDRFARLNTDLGSYVHHSRSRSIITASPIFSNRINDVDFIKPYGFNSIAALFGTVSAPQKSFYQQLVNKYFQGIISPESMKQFNEKITSYGGDGFEHMDYGSLEFYGSMFKAFDVQFSNGRQVAFNRSLIENCKSNFIFTTPIISRDWISEIFGCNVMFVKRYQEEDKKVVYLNKFDIQVLSDFSLNGATMDNPKTFMEFHNKYNDRLRELACQIPTQPPAK